ncbi:MAG: MobA/MobL family protein [Clostridiales bacterium]|nr:MobA/MobL family protein [Clostridiales bacterium]
MTPAAAEAQGLERASKHPKSTKYGRQNPISARWNSIEQLSAWRAAWADTCNRWLERAGQETRIDHRSHSTRGLDEKPTIHEGVSARKLEAAGLVSERCEVNRQIRADNALVRNLKATIQKIRTALETTIPALAAAMETVRQNVIVFIYGLLHIRRRKKEVTEYATKARRGYEDYRTLHSRIRVKLDERKTLQAERDRLGLLSVGKRKELKARLSELSEEIEELRFQETLAMHVFEKNDAAGMKQVWADIASAEKDVIRLGKDEVTLTDAISREAETFRTLKEQANALDLAELTDARLSLREQMEARAKARIRKAMSSGQVSFWDFRSSIQDADVLLGETGMAERWEREKRFEVEAAHENKKHRARSRESDR